MNQGKWEVVKPEMAREEVEALVENISGRGKLEERQHWCGGGGRTVSENKTGS